MPGFVVDFLSKFTQLASNGLTGTTRPFEVDVLGWRLRRPHLSGAPALSFVKLWHANTLS